MKTTYLTITASLLLLAGLSVSCDGCKDKKATDTEEVNVSVETNGQNSAYDRTSGNDANSDGTYSGTKSGSNSSATSKTGKSKNGYSAPDGTDAENHDGDMYTKHDTTPQASGPPIK